MLTRNNNENGDDDDVNEINKEKVNEDILMFYYGKSFLFQLSFWGRKVDGYVDDLIIL